MKYFLICMLFISSVSAAELEVGVMTHHWFTRGLNENNQLIGTEIADVEVSTFINSYGDRSWSVGYRYRMNTHLSFSFGGIKGYEDNAQYNPCRVGEIVCYGFLNLDLPFDERVGLRGRVSPYVSLVTFYFNG